LWKKTNLTQTEKSVLTGLLSAYVFHNIFVFDNLVSYIVFFSLAGFLHYKSLFSESVQVSDQTQVTKDINKDMYYYGILPLSMIVLIAMLYFFVVSPMQDAKNIIKLSDPVGKILYDSTRETGLRIRRISTPLGVLLAIFESRPNVTSDISALSLKSGNAVILRCGSDSINSSKILADIYREALEKFNIDPNVIDF
jgi:hypothetical protein